MSLALGSTHGDEACFPRVSGDEPGRRNMTLPELEFSPRERG